MANYLVTDTELTQVANAIRAKAGGSSGLVFPAGFINKVAGIGINVSETTRTIDQSGTIYISGKPLQTEIMLPIAMTFDLEMPYRADLMNGDSVMASGLSVMKKENGFWSVYHYADPGAAAVGITYNKIRLYIKTFTIGG